MRDEVDALFGARPEVAGVLRAMLLGDRSFVDRDEATDFQKTGVFHVLVVAGLHVGALAALLFWLARKLRLSPGWAIFLVLTLLFAYVAVVEQRPPVLRAALMATAVVTGSFLYRRLDLLNSASLAAMALLLSRPLALRFEFSTDVRGDRLYRRAGVALAGSDRAARHKGVTGMA